VTNIRPLLFLPARLRAGMISARYAPLLAESR